MGSEEYSWSFSDAAEAEDVFHAYGEYSCVHSSDPEAAAIDRIATGLANAELAGFEAGEKEGYMVALSDVLSALDIGDDGMPDDITAAEKWLVERVAEHNKEMLEEAKMESFNEGVEALVDALDTKRAVKVGESLYKVK